MIISILALLSLACGGSRSDSSGTSSDPASATEAPQAAAPADDGSIHVGTDGEALAFSPKTLTAVAGEEVTVTFTNNANSSKHTWVLVIQGSSTRNDVAALGIAAGAENGYVKLGDPNVIAKTDLTSGKTSAKVTFIAPAAGTYQFVCTFPSHDRQMWGEFIVTN